MSELDQSNKRLVWELWKGLDAAGVLEIDSLVGAAMARDV